MLQAHKQAQTHKDRQTKQNRQKMFKLTLYITKTSRPFKNEAIQYQEINKQQ